jgi:hypothetical protein
MSRKIFEMGRRKKSVRNKISDNDLRFSLTKNPVIKGEKMGLENNR